MKLLLDTHVLIWLLRDDPVLPADVVAMTEDETNEFYYSIASFWEYSIKHHLHPEALRLTPKRLMSCCALSDMNLLQISPKHIVALDTLRWPESLPEHKDPFDRLLIAQAKAEGMVLVTHDATIARYEEKCIRKV